MSTPPPPAPPPLPAKARPLLLRFVVGSALLALVAAGLIPGFYLVEKHRGRAAWRAYETEAKARGVKLDFADYLPPEIPDAENFASIPLFDAVFRASDANLDVPDPFELPGAKTRKQPKFADPVKQERIDLAAWQKFFVENKLLPTATDNAAADVLKVLDGFAEPLSQLDAAGVRPHCRFPVHWEKTFDAALPHLGLVTNAGKLYALRLAAHLALGESAAACQDFHAGVRLTTATHEEPALITGLVRITCAWKMEQAVWDGLAGHRWAEPELREIEADLAQLDWLDGYRLAMGSERGVSNLIADRLIDKRGELAELIRGVQMFPQPKPLSDKWTYDLFPAGWFYRSKVRSNQHFDEMLARFEPAQRRWFGERAVPSSPKRIKDLPTKIRYLPFMLAAPVLEDCETRFVQVATVTDQTRIACALERFRLARGTFPQALSELTPEFLSAVPAEIVNGEPYRYRRTDDGSFVLYSVGTDLRDDGGIIDPKATASKQADWVWRYPQQVAARL